MSAIFISYSQADRQCAHELVAHLEGQGLRCWLAPRDISPSADWAAEIIDAIAAARVMVLVFSASSNQSPQVRREVERAVHRGVAVLPFRIEDVLPSRGLEYFLSAQHWMDAFPPPRERHYAALAAHLAGESDRAAAAATAPAALPMAPRAAAAAAVGPGFTAAQLTHIEAELASYIGPLARMLVQREARRAPGAEELIAALSNELDADADRSRFAQTCRRLAGAR